MLFGYRKTVKELAKNIDLLTEKIDLVECTVKQLSSVNEQISNTLICIEKNIIDKLGIVIRSVEDYSEDNISMKKFAIEKTEELINLESRVNEKIQVGFQDAKIELKNQVDILNGMNRMIFDLGEKNQKIITETDYLKKQFDLFESAVKLLLLNNVMDQIDDVKK